MQRVPTVPTLEKGLRASIRPVLRSEEHTSELQSQSNLVCRLLLEKKNSPQLSPNVSPSTTAYNTSFTASKYCRALRSPSRLRSSSPPLSVDNSRSPCRLADFAAAS